MMNARQKNDVSERLNKIEGQIRGLNNMVSEDRYCIDILTQTRATVAAIRKVEDLVMFQHLRTCVVESMESDQQDQNQKIDEIIDVFSKLRKNG